MVLVPLGVHALPKAVMAVGIKLSGAGRGFERFLFQNRLITGDAIEEAAFTNEEPAIDPAGIDMRLFAEFRDPRTIEESSPNRAAGRTAVTVTSLALLR